MYYAFHLISSSSNKQVKNSLDNFANVKILFDGSTTGTNRNLQFRPRTERKIAYHLELVRRKLGNGFLDEHNIENMDETHFIYDVASISACHAVKIKRSTILMY